MVSFYCFPQIRSREPHGVQPRGIIGGRREPSGDPLPQREPAAPIPANIKNLTSLSGVLDPATSASLGIMTERPKRPDQAVESIRISTYTNWPPSLPLQPAELAHAGFYYAGETKIDFFSSITFSLQLLSTFYSLTI